MRPQALAEFWSLAVELATERGILAHHVRIFDTFAVGLIPCDGEPRDRYEVTPLNADTFAHTGGDGVHFSFLHLPSRTPDQSPIVMTVPMNLGGPWNYMVGDTFPDFLALGCRTGYFGLEQLAYDRGGTIADIESGDRDDFDDDDRHLLAAIRDRFHLTPWTNVRARLDDLARRYTEDVKLSATALEWLIHPDRAE